MNSYGSVVEEGGVLTVGADRVFGEIRKADYATAHEGL